MNVRELIALLADLDPELPVAVVGEGGDWTERVKVWADPVNVYFEVEEEAAK